jgi:hypothetical protein
MTFGEDFDLNLGNLPLLSGTLSKALANESTLSGPAMAIL